ncbi:dTDP-4-dehydrorhamnose reductase [Bacillus altitudinis]|uniref:dTDP-4-dehydrorhamnose reductase n=1 Tax=Bacillus altitudinis TaxID=293387 RepID=UPI00201C2305|nr:dTDP-4-dehydrorhamnose reductase [Bacillus altitudinis]
MRILLIGSDGSLGSEFLRQLKLNKLYTVYSFNKKKLDITLKEEIVKVFNKVKPQIVINCAAYTDVEKAEVEPAKAILVNGTSTKYLAEATDKIGAIFVHFSTDYVFNGKQNIPYTEKIKTNPLNVYGESKRLGEKYIEESTTRYFIIRTSWLFGRGGKKNFVDKILDFSEIQKDIPVITDQIGSPTYTVDLASATLDLILTNHFGIYHIVNKGIASRYTFAQEILRHSKSSVSQISKVDSKSYPNSAERPKFSALDSLLFSNVIGYELPNWRVRLLQYLKERRSGETFVRSQSSSKKLW